MKGLNLTVSYNTPISQHSSKMSLGAGVKSMSACLKWTRCYCDTCV